MPNGFDPNHIFADGYKQYLSADEIQTLKDIADNIKKASDASLEEVKKAHDLATKALIVSALAVIATIIVGLWQVFY